MQPAILIVDDEPHLLRLLVRVFEREGFTVHATGVVDEACEILAASDDLHLAALVLDAGIAPRVLHEVTPRASDIAVVLVSGDHLAADLVAWIERHGGRFLRKPFLPVALVDTVRSGMDAVRTEPGRSDPAQ
jgi:DNA-binding NtrC family response regulator